MNEPRKLSPAAVALLQKSTVFAMKRNGGRENGWASAQGIDAKAYVFASEIAQDEAEIAKVVDDWKSSVVGEVLAIINNDSAYAQYLEKQVGADGKTIIAKRASRVAKRENYFAGFQS